MKLLTIILNIFQNDVLFYIVRGALILANVVLLLWLLSDCIPFPDIGFHWLVIISVILICAFWGIYRLKRGAANKAQASLNNSDPGYSAGSDAGVLSADMPDRASPGMAAKVFQIIILAALCSGLTFEVFLREIPGIMDTIAGIFKSEKVVRTEAELMGIKAVEILNTGFSSIDMEDLHYDEGFFSGRYLDGLCIKKYRIYYGYQNIGNYLDDDKVMNAVCSGNTAALPKPEILAANGQSRELEGNYTMSGECNKWDQNQQYRNMKLMGFMNQYGLLDVRGSQEKLRKYLQPACDTIYARKAEAVSAAVKMSLQTVKNNSGSGI